MDKRAAMASTSWGRAWMPPRPEQQSPHCWQSNTGFFLELSVIGDLLGLPALKDGGPKTGTGANLGRRSFGRRSGVFQRRLAGGFQDAAPQGRIQLHFPA